MDRTLKLLAISFIILVSLSSFSSAEDKKDESLTNVPSFTLNDLYSKALTEAESIQRAKEDVLIAQKDKQRALSVLIPRFTAFGSYSWTDLDQDTAPPVTGEPAALSMTTDSAAWGLRFDQSFTLNGKELIALAISKEYIEKSDLDLNTAKETYLFQVASAYYNVLRAFKGWEIAKASVKRLEKHRDAVRTRLKLEDVTKTDMFRAESELSDAQAKLIEDQNRYLYAKAALRSLVNLPGDYALQEPAEKESDFSVPDLEVLKEEGLAHRTEIKSAKKLQIVSEKSVKLAKGEYWPTITLEGQYAEQDDSNSGTLDYDQDTSAFLLGAKLTFTLFDGGLRNAEIKQSLARERQARLSISEISKQISLDIEDSYLQLMTQKSRLTSLNDKLSFSQQNYLAVSEQFKHGLSNSVDMMDANTLLVAAERELSDAQFGYKLAQLKLKRSTGTFLTDMVASLTE